MWYKYSMPIMFGMCKMFKECTKISNIILKKKKNKNEKKGRDRKTAEKLRSDRKNLSWSININWVLSALQGKKEKRKKKYIRSLIESLRSLLWFRRFFVFALQIALLHISTPAETPLPLSSGIFKCFNNYLSNSKQTYCEKCLSPLCINRIEYFQCCECIKEGVVLFCFFGVSKLEICIK